MITSFLRRLIPARVANNGSQQRDHHANERTFLSWTRAGLGFAAVGLAMDRIAAIDHVMAGRFGLGQAEPPAQIQQSTKEQQEQTLEPRSNPKTALGALSKHFTTSRICQLIGVWCLGYGFFRYWSIRRYLLRGEFVPAFWGPVFMTCGSLGASVALGSHGDRPAFS
ncbi:hypothetical protein N7478_009958 [Penicillium angulare]|uniref:uncharacterized protein n=1 Tax=Penicillium angulare TaxID=116970 RepID=UPI002542108A|nr:uncharacterized protein N7478_009958 [Penicillium angulare]KAJ5267150.1 hypothetical protein N7478_009958 [Penicillium angulare]